VDTIRIAQPAREATTTTRKETRVDRALTLYVEHAEAIALSFNRGVYRVPSCTGAATYSVRIVPEAYCSCPDFRGGECKHSAAVRVVRKATAPCAGCGRRFFHPALVEAGDGHLTFFEGDVLCPECAGAHGVL
jgi:hypothetical protein